MHLSNPIPHLHNITCCECTVKFHSFSTIWIWVVLRIDYLYATTSQRFSLLQPVQKTMSSALLHIGPTTSKTIQQLQTKLCTTLFMRASRNQAQPTNKPFLTKSMFSTGRKMEFHQNKSFVSNTRLFPSLGGAKQITGEFWPV